MSSFVNPTKIDKKM